MQATIDLRDEDAVLLNQLGEREKLSSKELIERVVSEYVARHRSPAFGIWKGRGVDGLEYQRRLREEWPD